MKRILKYILLSLMIILLTGMPKVELNKGKLKLDININKVQSYTIDNIIVKEINLTQLSIEYEENEQLTKQAKTCYGTSKSVFMNDLDKGEYGRGCHALFQINKTRNNNEGLTMGEAEHLCSIWNKNAVVTKVYSEDMQNIIHKAWLKDIGNGHIRIGLQKIDKYEGTTDLTYSEYLYEPARIPYSNFENDIKDFQHSNVACVTVNVSSGIWEPSDCKSKESDGVLCFLSSCNETIDASFGIDPVACSGNGICSLKRVHDHESSQGECECSAGYFGSSCLYYTCYGLEHNDTNVCSGNGTCNSGNNCTCNPGFAGKTCEKLCPPGSYNDGNIMSNPENDCKPCPAGYACPQYGQTSVEIECPKGTYSKEGSSSCLPCTEGYYCPHTKSTFESRIRCKKAYGSPPYSSEFTNCTIPLCVGKQATDPSVCSKHGLCIEDTSDNHDNHYCNCYLGFKGVDCQTAECSGELPRNEVNAISNMKILSPYLLKYTLESDQIQSYIYDTKLIRSNIQSEHNKNQGHYFKDDTYTIITNKTSSWNKTYLEWKKSSTIKSLLQYNIDDNDHCSRNIEYFIPLSKNDVYDDWFSLEKQFPLPDTGTAHIIISYFSPKFTSSHIEYTNVFKKTHQINHNVSSSVRKLGQGKVETSMSASLVQIAYDDNEIPQSNVKAGGQSNMECCSVEHDPETKEDINIEDIYKFTIYFDISAVQPELKHHNVSINAFHFIPSNTSLNNFTKISNITIPSIISNGVVTDWAKKHNFSLVVDRLFNVETQSGSLNRHEKMEISFASASLPRLIYDIKIEGKVLIDAQREKYAHFSIFSDLDLRHRPFSQKIPIGSVIVVVVIAVVSGVLGVVTSSAVIGSVASASAFIVRGGAGIGEKAVKFVTSNLKSGKDRKYPAFDFSFNLISDKVEQLDTKTRSLQHILRDLRASKYTAYVHCKVCYNELQKNLNEDSAIEHCTTCGFPLLQYMYGEERDELFCVLCSLMYRYLNSAHGSHYRCSLHAAGKNKVQGSIYVLYKKHFSVSNAHRKRKASKKSEKLVELIKDPIWKFNLLIRFECLWIIKELVNEERDGYKSIPIITKALLKVRNRISEIGDDMLNDKHSDGSPRDIPPIVSQLNINLNDPNLPEKHEFYHALYNNLSKLQNRLQLHLHYLIYQRDVVKTEDDPTVQIDSFPEENSLMTDEDLCFSILSNKSNSQLLSDDQFSFGSMGGNISNYSKTRTRDQYQKRVKKEEVDYEPPVQKKRMNPNEPLYNMDFTSSQKSSRLSPIGPNSTIPLLPQEQRPVQMQPNLVNIQHTTPSPPPPQNMTDQQAKTLAFLQAQQLNIERQISMLRNMQMQQTNHTSTIPPPPLPPQQPPPSMEFTDFKFKEEEPAPSQSSNQIDTISSHGINIMDLTSMFSSPSPEMDNELLPTDGLFYEEDVNSLFQ